MAKSLLILGSTGSIGRQALQIVAGSDDLTVVGLSAQRNWSTLVAQARELGVRRVALTDAEAAKEARRAWQEGEVLDGSDGVTRLISEADVDLVLNGIVGSAGLGATVVTLGEGIDLALANKESLVVGGELVTTLAEASGARILPVDSEHSAIFQLLEGRAAGTVDRLVLTASGGPFRGFSPKELRAVEPEQALAHPTWNMGGKITIDSATLMNKGLELIEAHHLFGFPYDAIDVVVHPESIVHSMIDLNDGATLAHMGYPDMRVPISFALHYPQRADVPVDRLDLAKTGSLSFEEPDFDTFPCLELARQSGGQGGLAPCVMNAANEVAVHAFLAGRLSFVDISDVIERTLDSVELRPAVDFEELYEADSLARQTASALVDRGVRA